MLSSLRPFELAGSANSLEESADFAAAHQAGETTRDFLRRFRQRVSIGRAHECHGAGFLVAEPALEHLGIDDRDRIFAESDFTAPRAGHYAPAQFHDQRTP
jgi:hypothetical protein